MVDVKIGELAEGKMTRRKATLRRIETGDDGTFGVLSTDSGFQCYVGELSWKKNKGGCIPPGVYNCAWVTTPKHGPVYEVQGVPGRTGILLHSGNWLGDESKGLKANSLGCLIPGRAIGAIAGQKAVLSSRDALQALENDLEREPFQLTVEWGNSIPKEAYI